MKRLNIMTLVILLITALLVCNTVGAFSYRDSVLLFETKKDSMLNFIIKYDTLLGQLRNDTLLYIETRDDRYKTNFYRYLNAYETMDHISLGYRTFTHIQSSGKQAEMDASADFSMAMQAEFLGFTEEEKVLYEDFLDSYNLILEKLSLTMKKQDQSFIASSAYGLLYEDLQQSLNTLSKNYMKRLNTEEDSAVENQNLLEFTLICLSSLLFALAIMVFYLLSKENRLNSYFRKLYTTLVENVNVGLSITNSEGIFEYMNAKFKSLLDVDAYNPLGRTAEELFSDSIAQCLTASGSQSTEGHLSLKIGDEERYMDYDHFIIYDENKQKKYIDLFHDTTETEKMQLQQRKQLQEIEFYSKAKDAFLANMSHEIKTPINAIVGMTYFLKESGLSEKQRNLIEKIESSSEVLLSIVNDVLDLSKIKAHALKLYPTPFRLGDVVKSVEDMFTAQIKAKGLTYSCLNRADDQLWLYLDRTRFLQILVNLMGNAYKFTDTGTITLSIDVTRETETNVILEFCVEDTGIGISKQDISKLFHEFGQLENHLTKQHQGTGLGLSICKHIVETMGGHVWITSIFGKGSRFHFTLPAEKVTDKSLIATTSVATAASKSCKFDGKGLRALVVEDTEINREVAVNLLYDVNVLCDTAKDGVEALEQCEKHPDGYYTVILMDIHMPRMDGYTAADTLKNEMHITSPIVALTATTLDDSAKLQYRDIIDSFLPKPFKVEDFYSTLSVFFTALPALQGQSPPSAAPTGTESVQAQAQSPFSGRTMALHNMGGIEAMYQKHVGKFKANYKDSGREIAAQLECRNFQEAKRLAHSVKGLSGTLGMLPLQNAASVLDQKITAQLEAAAKSSGESAALAPNLKTDISLSDALSMYQAALNAVIETPL